MKTISKTLALFFILINMSCSIFGSLTSETTIQANDSFVLGNNKHQNFKVVLQNTSSEEVKVYQTPITGGSHSPQMVKPNEIVTVKVNSDTALRIENKSNKTVNVKLKVTGDKDLSMGYQK